MKNLYDHRNFTISLFMIRGNDRTNARAITLSPMLSKWYTPKRSITMSGNRKCFIWLSLYTGEKWNANSYKMFKIKVQIALLLTVHSYTPYIIRGRLKYRNPMNNIYRKMLQEKKKTKNVLNFRRKHLKKKKRALAVRLIPFSLYYFLSIWNLHVIFTFAYYLCVCAINFVFFVRYAWRHVFN